MLFPPDLLIFYWTEIMENTIAICSRLLYSAQLSLWNFLLLISAYLLCVSLLRHQRAKSLWHRYAPAGKGSFDDMTVNEAQIIMKELTELEFPKLFGFSIIFALFKACSPAY